MILKMPCNIGGVFLTCAVNRDSINFIQPSEGGAKTLIYINMISTPMQVDVAYDKLVKFVAHAHHDGAMQIASSNPAQPATPSEAVADLTKKKKARRK